MRMEPMYSHAIMGASVHAGSGFASFSNPPTIKSVCLKYALHAQDLSPVAAGGVTPKQTFVELGAGCGFGLVGS
jgi:hypothetical protein